MKFKLFFALFFVVAVLAIAQSAKPKVEVAKPAPPAPSISAEHRAEFFKRQLAVNQAQQLLQQAVSEMMKDCGDHATLTMGPNGDPVCIVNPPAAEKK